MRLSRGGIGLLAAAAVALAGLLLLVVFRSPIAEAAARRAFADRGLASEFELTRFDFDRAIIEDLKLGDPDAPVLAARRVEVRYGPIDLMRGRYRALAIDGLELRLALGRSGLQLAGGHARGDAQRGPRPWPEGARAPALSIPDGLIRVASPAGEVAASFIAQGDPETGWTIEIAAAPATLEREGAALEVTAGALNAVIGPESARFDGELQIASLTGPQTRLQGLTARFDVAGAYADMERLAGLVADGAVGIELVGGEIDPALIEQVTSAAWISRLRGDAVGEASAVADDADAPSGEAGRLAPHIDAFSAMLAVAAEGLSASAAFDLALADGRIAMAPAGAAEVVAESGLHASLAPVSDIGGAIVIDAAAGAVEARDLGLDLVQPGVFSAELDVSQARAVLGGPRLEGRALVSASLAPWTADDLTVLAEASNVEVVVEPESWRARAAAEVRLDSAREGLLAEGVAARFDVAAAYEAADDLGQTHPSIAFRPAADAAQHFAAERLVVAGRELFDVEAQVRPKSQDGALARVYLDGGGVLQTRLGEATAGVDIAGRRITARLPAAELEAAFSGGRVRDVRVYAQAPRFEATFGARDAFAQASLIEATVSRAAPPVAGHVAQARFEGLTVSGPAAPLRITRAAGEIDLVIDRGRPQSGALVLAGAEVEDAAERSRFVPLTMNGRAEIADAQLTGSLAGGDGSGRHIVTVDIDHAFEMGAGRAVAATPVFVFAPGELTPRTISPALAPFAANVDGRARAEARLEWNEGGLFSSGVLSLEQVSFDSARGRVEEATMDFNVADLFTWTTDAPQRVEIGAFDAGLAFENVTLDLSLRDGARIGVEALEAPFAGGVITAEPGEIDFAASQSSLVLIADAISMEALRQAIAPPVVEASGRLSGRIPIVLDRRGALIIGAQLAADGPGEVRYAGRAGEGVAAQEASRRRGYAALENFEFDAAQVVINGEVEGDLTVEAQLSGRGREVEAGANLEVTLGAIADFSTLSTGEAFRAIDVRAVEQGAAPPAAAAAPD
ncbi:MAG: YdbH domain-containing protein [Maricaulaceae bacterium]|jgi:hypothetical protein